MSRCDCLPYQDSGPCGSCQADKNIFDLRKEVEELAEYGAVLRRALQAELQGMVDAGLPTGQTLVSKTLALPVPPAVAATLKENP